MKQRISLGRGLVRKDVAAILLDEPLTVIDPHVKWLLRRKLKQIHEQLAVTLVYVTHDQVEALTLADQVVVMNERPGGAAGHAAGAVRAPGAHLRGLLHRQPRHEPAAVRGGGDAAVVEGERMPLSAGSAPRARAAGGDAAARHPARVPARLAEGAPGAVPGARSTQVEDLGGTSIVTGAARRQELKVKLPEAGARSRAGEPLLSLEFPPRLDASCTRTAAAAELHEDQTNNRAWFLVAAGADRASPSAPSSR